MSPRPLTEDLTPAKLEGIARYAEQFTIQLERTLQTFEVAIEQLDERADIDENESAQKGLAVLIVAAAELKRLVQCVPLTGATAAARATSSR